MRPWTCTALVGSLATLVLVGTARAQTVTPNEVSCPASPALAKGAGDQAMLANRHAEAFACYEAAYRYAPSPALLYNQARALEFLHHNAEALRRLLQFQRGATSETIERVPQLPQLIQSLRGRVGELEIVCSVEGAEISIDGSPIGRTPLPEPLLVDPATVHVRVQRNGYTAYESELLVNAGEHRVLRIQLEPALPTAMSPAPAAVVPASSQLLTPTDADAGVTDSSPSESNGALRVAAWTTLGVGIAGAALAGVSYTLARSHRSDVCGGASQCSSDDYDADALDSYESWRDLYVGSLVVSGVGLAAGGLLLWTSSTESDENSASHTNLGVSVTPGGFRVSGQF